MDEFILNFSGDQINKSLDHNLNNTLAEVTGYKKIPINLFDAINIGANPPTFKTLINNGEGVSITSKSLRFIDGCGRIYAKIY